MNKLSISKKTRVIAALVEGVSVNATSRMTGVAKNTRFRERWKLQFRAEFFNFFNHTNFFQPARTVNVAAPAFGSISSATRPREMQFGMKLEF